MPDLWPDDFGKVGVAPPIVLLREQAERISGRTQGKVLGQVATGKNAVGFYHDFFLVAPFLDDYTYRLFAVVHPIDFYPLEIVADVVNKQIKCQSPSDFEEQLRGIFTSAEAKKVVASLLE